MGHQYSNEEKMAAIQLFNKLGHYTWVIAELGYPSRGMLMLWVKEYMSTGQVARKDTHKYSEEQRKIAVDYYLNNGMSIKKTVTALGYPGKTLLGEWINADVPREKIRYRCKRGGSVVRYSKEQKIEAVSKYCGGASPTEISKEYSIAPGTVYVWKKSLLGSENEAVMKPQSTVESNTPEKSIEELIPEKDALEKKVVELQNEIYRLQMQKDILEKAGELLKKEKGIDLQKLTNKEKAVLINALRNYYRLKDLLEELQIAKSSYCYQSKTALRPDKYEGVRKEITDIFSENYRAYGYRRIHSVLRSKNIHMSEKTVRRIMREEGLSVAVISRKKYSSYKGEISPEVPNLLQRNFHAEMPNKK